MKSKIIKDILKIFILVIILELTLFNYKFYLTIFNKPVEVDNYNIENMEIIDDVYVPYEGKDGSIIINTDGKDINNLYLNINNKNDKLLTYKIEVYDLESEQYVYLNTVNSYRGVKASFYKTIPDTHNTDKYKITLIATDKPAYKINNIIINPVTPIHFNILRVLLLLSFIGLAYILKNNNLYKTKVTNNKVLNRILALTGIILIGSTFVLTNINPVFRNNRYYSVIKGLYAVNEYQLLAESLTKGKLYLEIEPTKKLEEIDNPYNFEERKKEIKDGDYFLWDTAYYKNHYYVYFGVIPVIFTYLPFYAITHHHISNNIVVFIGLAGIIVNILILLKKLTQKYFENTSIGTLLLFILLITIGNHFILTYSSKRPDFYSIPIIWGLMFTLIGLNLWLSSIDDNKINKVKLSLGSLSMALVAGCRPQLLLVSFSSIIIFYDYLKKNKKKDLVKNLLSFSLPYIVVAILLMLYNYFRFSSPFDFGANYNLTTNDMTVRGFNIERIGLGLYYYLFSLPRTINKFPFFEVIPLSTSYIGTTIYEDMFGGLLILYPILWLNVFIFKFKKLFKSKMLYRLCLLFIISSLIIIIADTNMAGILPRYYLDFTWMLFLSATIIFLYIYEHYKNNTKIIDNLNKGLLVLLMISIVANFLMIFVDLSYSYKVDVPTIYYYFYFLTQFWL